MSFAGLSYDPCAYSKSLKESIAVGGYILDERSSIPPLKAFPTSPYVRLEKTGGSTCASAPLIDVDSELLGLHRSASKCPDSRFKEEFCNSEPLGDWGEFLSPEETKLSNPPCTLRGTGWNRWEWLCRNPQEKALIPFETEIQNKLVVRDNHRPCVPRLLEQGSAHPRNAEEGCYTDLPGAHLYEASGEPHPPTMHWRKCCEIALL